MTFESVAGLYNYWIVIFLMMTGFYIVLARKNLIKTVIGLNIFQTSVFLLYVTMGKITGGTAPIVPPQLVTPHSVTPHSVTPHSVTPHFTHDPMHQTVSDTASQIVYSNPLPSVLMLTAIVVGIATTALALALVVRIREDYGTVDEERILELDRGE
jgi:multicomponent Na+:H+ antiporter subunit C